MKHHRIQTPDDDFLDLHVQRGQPELPTVLLLHGLEGNAQSKYNLGLQSKLGALGWTVVTMEFRSCGAEMNRAPRMYHLGETSDLDFVVSWLIEEHSATRVFVTGVSLGGNVVLKWLGERGATLPAQVIAAAAICPPYNLITSGPYMDSAFMTPYRRWFLKTLIAKAVEKDRQYPGRMDIEKVRRAKTFAEFDTHATAALHGFRDAEDYWRRSSCHQFLSEIQRPTLLISSEDDPFNPKETIPVDTCESSPWLIPQFTRRGGHVGFVSIDETGQTAFWAEDQVIRFFQFCHAC